MANYQPWYERFPERFAEEKAEMAARGFVLDEDALARRQAVIFRGRSQADPARELTVEYSDAFPSMPPRVMSKVEGNLLTFHQTPETGEICTFGQRQQRWSARLSGTTAIDEADDVIRNFRPGSAPPSEEQFPEPASATYHYSPNLYFLAPPPLTKLHNEVPNKPVTGTFQLLFKPSEVPGQPTAFVGRGIITKVKAGDAVFEVENHYRKWLNAPQKHHGTLVILPEPPPHIASPKELKAWLEALGVRRSDWMAFAFPEGGEGTGERYWTWVAGRVRADYTFFFGKTFLLRSPQENVRIPGTEGLVGKKVSIIGCGCLGSKIAVALAATGVSQIFLLDRDLFEPDNAVRHECGVRQFGVPKVEAVWNRIYEVNPTVEISASNFQIGSTVHPDQQRFLFDQIASSDLVIEATGVHGVSRFINDLCYELGVPSIYVSVTSGAWGGEVVRVIPRRTGCWMCWVNQYYGETPSSAPAPAVGVFAPGCNQPTFTGTTYEAGMVANLAAWVAVETLLAGCPGRQDFRGDYLRWTGRDSDGVPAPATKVLPVAIAEDCPLCRKS